MSLGPKFTSTQAGDGPKCDWGDDDDDLEDFDLTQVDLSMTTMTTTTTTTTTRTTTTCSTGSSTISATARQKTPTGQSSIELGKEIIFIIIILCLF